MKAITSLSLLCFVKCVLAHDHSGPAKGETVQQYAQRHMSSEHHIDSFDTRSFHSLHDFNRDGFWDRDEIEGLYGVHHVYSAKIPNEHSAQGAIKQTSSKDQAAQQQKADFIVDSVLRRLDLDQDGRVSVEELVKVGLDGLPNFDDLGAEGHHYDVESEFFLHHEEQFHSTPETQTDDAYSHPEDQEHFAMHEAIERAEAEREAKFQGVTVEEILQAHLPHPPPPSPADSAADAAATDKATSTHETHENAPDVPAVPHPHDEQVQSIPPVVEPPIPKVTRLPPPEKQDPKIRFKDAPDEAKRKGDWGTGEGGYKRPTQPSDRLRKYAPYKYKFRRNWGDF